MNTRAFGRDKIEISDIGLGCWQIGGNWGHIEEEAARNILKSSLDSGVTFLDTADVYGGGRSETIIGNFLKDVARDDVFVATKVGRASMFPDAYTREGIRSDVEAGMKRLQVDALDLVQTHCVPTDVMKSGEIYGWLDELVSEGKIKRYGASVESMNEANLLLDQVENLYSLQIIFNIFRQKPIDALFGRANEKQVGIIARVPLASGVLTGKFSSETQFGNEDHRRFNKNGESFNVGETFAGVPFEKGIELAARIEELKPDSMSMAQMALRWILDHDAISVVIPGASSVSQAKGNAAVSELASLNSGIHSSLRNLYENAIHEHVRGVY